MSALGRITVLAVALELLVFGFALGVPPAAACDENSITCWDGEEPPAYQHRCEAYLTAADVTAVVFCYVELNLLQAPGAYKVDDAAPNVAPGGRVRVNVTIERNSGASGDLPWGFRFQEGIAGVAFDGKPYHSGNLSAARSSVSFEITIGATDPAPVGQAVVGVAFWGAEHDVQYGYLGIDIDGEPPILNERMLAWVAVLALCIAVLALIVALVAWKRAGSPP